MGVIILLTSVLQMRKPRGYKLSSNLHCSISSLGLSLNCLHFLWINGYVSLSALCSNVIGLLLGGDHIALGNLTVNNPRMRPVLVQEVMVGWVGFWLNSRVWRQGAEASMGDRLLSLGLKDLGTHTLAMGYVLQDSLQDGELVSEAWQQTNGWDRAIAVRHHWGHRS